MAQTATRFLPVRLAAILALAALVFGLATSWIAGGLGAWLPYSGAIPLTSLPHFLCGIAVALAVLLAPLTSTANAPKLSLTQLAFASLFQGAMFQFFLMVTARLVPLDPAGIALSATALALFAFCCLLLSDVLPRAYTGVMFFWVLVLPLICYHTADVFVYGPGGSKGWQAESSAPIFALTHAMLALSPGTAIAATLDGALLDNSPTLPGLTFGLLAVLAGSLTALRVRAMRQGAKSEAMIPVVGTSA